jgi:hypothetical protein
LVEAGNGIDLVEDKFGERDVHRYVAKPGRFAGRPEVAAPGVSGVDRGGSGGRAAASAAR